MIWGCFFGGGEEEGGKNLLSLSFKIKNPKIFFAFGEIMEKGKLAGYSLDVFISKCSAVFFCFLQLQQRGRKVSILVFIFSFTNF